MGIYEPSETSFDLYSGGTLERSAFIRGMIAFKSKLPIDLNILGHYCWYQCQKKKTSDTQAGKTQMVFSSSD